MVSRNSRTRRNVLAVSLAFAATLTAVPAFAEGQATDLDGVIVTATRTARTQGAATWAAAAQSSAPCSAARRWATMAVSGR